MNTIIFESRRTDSGSTPCPRHRRASRAVASLGALCTVVLGVGGCSLLPGGDTPDEVSAALESVDEEAEADRLALDDLLSVLVLTLQPVETTVQVSRRLEDPLVDRIARALAERQFGVQRVSADQGANFLNYSRVVEPLGEGNASRLNWSLSIGPVDVRRRYAVMRDGTLVTDGPVQLSGARLPASAPAPAVAGLGIAEPSHARVEYVAPATPERQGPVISLVTPAIVERVARSAAEQQSARNVGSIPNVQALNEDRVQTGNLFYDALSNFGPTLQGRDRVERQVVVFADDSLLLGPGNRELIRQLVADKVLREDLISLVGCSNGPTRTEIGNEGLALGRAERVVEELTALGIARERIFDEGCWAPVTAGERFPARGVVLELWRTPS